MGDKIKMNVVGHVTATTDVVPNDSTAENKYETMTPPTSPVDDLYESVSPRQTPELKEDSQGYLIPTSPIDQKESKTTEKTKNEYKTGPTIPGNGTERSGVVSIYEDLWAYRRSQGDNVEDQTLTDNNDDAIYDEVETIIPTTLPPGAKIISVEEPASAYDEVIINDGRYIIPSRQWDSDSDAFESDFDDDAEAPNYFGENLEELYENIENRKLASPTPRTVPFNVVNDNDRTLNSQGGLLGCFSGPFSKTSKPPKKAFDEEAPLYVDANTLGVKEPVMPPLSLDLSTEEAARYEIVKKILATEAAYKENLSLLVEIEKELRDRKLTEDKNLDVIFCSLENILQSHEMFSMVLASRMNEWTVEGKLGDIICASFSKSTTTMAYTEFVKNFLDAIDTFRAVCKSYNVFSQFVQVKINSVQPKATFHDLMLKPFERFPEFIILVQDCLEVTPVSHVDRVPLQLALTQLECLAELINSRRKESEMKSQLKYLDTQISQLNKPLSSSGRVFIRQDDMIHCLIDGVSVVGTKKLRLVLLSDMLLCLSPVGKKKKIVSGLLNTPKYKFKLKWNVPLSDVQFVEYGAGVSVAAGKYGTITTYSDQGKYRQSTIEIQKHIEDLQHDLAVIGQIAGLASSLRGKHQLLDQQKVQRWYKSVENIITEELKTVNMFWLELSLPTRSGQHNYVFNLSSTTVKDEWQADALNAKLALESRNNPGWYLPEDDLTCGLSILRRNMPLLAEYFDLFIFNTKSRVESTVTYPVESSNVSTSMATRGLGHYVWISARGEMQGHVSVVRFDRDAHMPRFAESFSVCPGTVYSIAHIPAMNSRHDQSAEKYHTKYGFPFPTVWLGSQSSKIYIYDASSDDRSRPLMELKLRDAPLAMKYAMRKVYVGLANGTLAIFRSNSSGHWNLVQPSILPLGRYPVAVIADVKDKLWCSSGSQIYVVSKNGDRIQRIIAVDSNMKNLVKHVVTCGVGVWVSVWRKATIKLYHAETCEMVQEVNVVSPVTKMKNDVDSQVQYLSLDKISVTALLFIPGFLWVGTSVGLILLYPLPKMQGVPRVIGRACVAFHAHCGPVRTLFAIPQGVIAEETTNDSANTAGEDPDEVDRKFSMLADSEESVESDEEFYFIDDNKNPSPKKNKLASSGVKPFSQRMKVTVKGPKEADSNSEITELSSNANSEEFSITQPGDFARMMTSFGGFSQDNSIELKERDGKSVRSYKNKLFEATQTKDSLEERHPDLPTSDGSNTPDTNALSGIVDNETKPNVPSTKYNESDGNKDDTFASSMPPVDSGTSDFNDVTNEKFDTEKSVECDENTGNVENEMTTDASTGSSSECVDDVDMDTTNQLETHKQNTDENILVEEKNDPAKNTSQTSENGHKVSSTNTQTDLMPSSPQRSENKEKASSPRNTADVSTPPEAEQEPKRNNEPTSCEALPNSSTSSKPLGKSQETYVTVLPDTLKQLDENSTKISNDSSMERGLENDSGSMFSKTGKSSAKCLSYLVVSGGEGHVDLRLKVKSKQDLKKGAESMFLIWRVNSKI